MGEPRKPRASAPAADPEEARSDPGQPTTSAETLMSLAQAAQVLDSDVQRLQGSWTASMVMREFVTRVQDLVAQTDPLVHEKQVLEERLAFLYGRIEEMEKYCQTQVEELDAELKRRQAAHRAALEEMAARLQEAQVAVGNLTQQGA